MRPHKLFWMALLGTGGNPTPYNEAVGGVISTFQVGDKWFRQHLFASSGVFQVISCPNPFTIALVGAGGAGGGGFIGASGYAGTGGGGGGGWEITQQLEATGYTVTVGAGGPATPYNGSGSVGGSTIAVGVTVGGGGGGQSGQSRQDSGDHPTPGGQGSAGGTSDGGTGSVPATFPGKAIRDKFSAGNCGEGGGGGGQDGPGGGGAGQPGAVVIQYEIAALAEPEWLTDPYQVEPFRTVAEVDRDTDEVMNLLIVNDAWMTDFADAEGKWFVPTPDEDGDEAVLGGYYIEAGERFVGPLQKETP